MRAAEKMLAAILDELEQMGIGDPDEPIDGGDAVDYLNDLRDDIKSFLKK